MAVPEHDKELAKVCNLVRLYMRDFSELNRLIDGEESSPRMIAWAIIDALDDFNSTPPLIGNFSVRSHPSIHLLVRGAAITLLQSVRILHTRNQLSYSDGGITIGKWDKAPLIDAFLQMLESTYQQRKLQLKVAINMTAALTGNTGVSSEYATVNSFYGSF